MKASAKAVAMIAAFSMTGHAFAQAKPCLQPAEANALLTFALPGALNAMADKCAPALGANSPMPTAARAMANRYRGDANAAWPVAKVAFGKMSDPKLIEAIGDDATKKLLDTGIGGAIINDFKADSCMTADRFIAALEPLPARNMALLIGAFIDMGSKGKDASKSPFNICARP